MICCKRGWGESCIKILTRTKHFTWKQYRNVWSSSKGCICNAHYILSLLYNKRTKNTLIIRKNELQSTFKISSCHKAENWPWMREALSHLMYHESGYLCKTSFEMDDIGRRSVDPALTAKLKVYDGIPLQTCLRSQVLFQSDNIICTMK